MQTIIAISLLVFAAGFLGWNFLGKKMTKSSDKGGDCGPDCKCGWIWDLSRAGPLVRHTELGTIYLWNV